MKFTNGKKKEKIPDYTIFDEIDLSKIYPYKNKELEKNWFDLDDRNVTPIPMNRI